MFASGDFVSKFVDKYVKINPNGVDLAPIKIYYIPDEGYVSFLDRNKRGFFRGDVFTEIYQAKKIIEPRDSYYYIKKGLVIEAVFPRVRVPADFVGIIYPRSTLNRLGIIKSQTGLLDSGYNGTPTQTFYFTLSAKINVNESWIQLTFVKCIEKVKKEYSGYYQNKVL